MKGKISKLNIFLTLAGAVISIATLGLYGLLIFMVITLVAIIARNKK